MRTELRRWLNAWASRIKISMGMRLLDCSISLADFALRLMGK